MASSSIATTYPVTAPVHRPTKLYVHDIQATAQLLDGDVKRQDSVQQRMQAACSPLAPTSPVSRPKSPSRISIAVDTGRPHSVPLSSNSGQASAQRELRRQQSQAQYEEQYDAIKRKAAEKKKEAEKASDKMLAEVFSGLDYDQGITGEITDTLTLHNKVRSQKRRQLHSEWTRDVYNKIADRIQAGVAKRNIADIEDRLRSNYQDYITTTNTKQAVFRDVIIEADYNPLQYRSQNVKYFDSDISDPAKRDIVKAERDRAMMGGAVRHEPQPGKMTLATTMWDKLESTPYGRNMDPAGNYVLKPVNEKLTALRASRVTMDHYTYPVGPAAVNAELSVGKAPVEPKPGDPWRKDLFDLMQRVDEMKTFAQMKAENKIQGDVWLGYQGRRVPPGPELRRGRKNLYDVVHHTCVEGLKKNPTFTGGDEWLERKGKRSVPGPEQRRGRKNLFETFQQSSNPLEDGRTLDDIFLERRGKKNVPFHPGHNMYDIVQDQNIDVAPAPKEVARHYISELIPVDGSLTTRTVPALTQR